MTWQGNDDAFVAILRSFNCGDPDASGTIAVDDVVWLIAYIFSSGNAPCDNDGDAVPDC